MTASELEHLYLTQMYQISEFRSCNCSHRTLMLSGRRWHTQAHGGLWGPCLRYYTCTTYFLSWLKVAATTGMQRCA